MGNRNNFFLPQRSKKSVFIQVQSEFKRLEKYGPAKTVEMFETFNLNKNQSFPLEMHRITTEEKPNQSLSFPLSC